MWNAAVAVVKALQEGKDISKIDIRAASQEDRIKYAENIQNNKAEYISIVQAYKWLRETYPKKFNALAMRGAGIVFDVLIKTCETLIIFF